MEVGDSLWRVFGEAGDALAHFLELIPKTLHNKSEISSWRFRQVLEPEVVCSLLEGFSLTTQ